jgi:O-antigen ligase
MIGVLLLVIWIGRRLLEGGYSQPRALRVTTALYAGSVLASYVAATTRPITPLEISAADRGLVSTAAWIGMLLFALDAPRTLSDLITVLRRLSLAGGAVAVLGLLQFATHLAFTNYIQIPGLSASHDLDSVTLRSNLTRPAGTALHPIEFGAVLTMVLPLAIHFAFTDTHRSRLRRWWPVAAIAVAVPISISRSAIVSAVVVLLVMLPTWTPAVRRRSYAALVMLSGALFVVVPGLLGTLRNLFTGISQDSSAQSRTGSYALASDFIQRSPAFGRGFRTFLPSYRILDNQYLLSTIETGIVGVLAFAALLIAAISASRVARRVLTDEVSRSLAQALTASMVAAACSFALYDSLSFPMAASLLFLVIGLTGALARLTITGTRAVKPTTNMWRP